MEQNGTVNFRHRRSPSSDRFLGVFSPTKPATALGDSESDLTAGDELNEDDVFWSDDFTEPRVRSSSPSSATNIRHPFRQPYKFGILAALSSDNGNPKQPLLQRKPSLSPTTTPFLRKTPLSVSPTQSNPFSRAIPSIPKPQNFNGYSQSTPARKFQHSAPVNVPIMPRKPRNGSLVEVDIDDDDAEDEMLPPHEIVSRGSAARSPKTTFSVLEGAGRTLRGRDLRQVRNAVWRLTGFQD